MNGADESVATDETRTGSTMQKRSTTITKSTSTPIDSLTKKILTIAFRHLGIQTLTTRNSDSADFHEVHVRGLDAALRAAYEAGKADGIALAKGAL